MRLVFLGTGGYHPSEQRHTAGLFLPEVGLLLDAGTGTFRLAGLVEQRDVTIALTHAHLDHVCGLTYLLVPLQQGVVERLRVRAASEVLETVHNHLFASQLFPVLPRATFEPLVEGQPIELAPGVRLHHQPLPGHPGGSRGYRLNWTDCEGRARSLAYITDTSVDGTYTEFIRGVDLLIHECYFPDDDAHWAERTGHSHTTPVATLARDAGVGRLVLTHLDPQRPEADPIGLPTARAIFPHTTVATDGLELEV